MKMKRIAAPMIGGMVTSTILTLAVIPAIYALWRGWGMKTLRSRNVITKGESSTSE